MVFCPFQAQLLNSERDRLQEVLDKGAGAATEEGRRLEALSTRKQQLVHKSDDLARKIRELGSLPAEAFEKYKDKGVQVRGRGWGRGCPWGGGWRQVGAAEGERVGVWVKGEGWRQGVLFREREIQGQGGAGEGERVGWGAGGGWDKGVQV